MDYNGNKSCKAQLKARHIQLSQACLILNQEQRGQVVKVFFFCIALKIGGEANWEPLHWFLLIFFIKEIGR